MSTLQSNKKKTVQTSAGAKSSSTKPHGQHKKHLQSQAMKNTDEENTANEKFKEIQTEHIQAAKKYTENYESSSDEEDLANESILESVFKGYSGDLNDIQKTQEFLEYVFQSGSSTCLICIGSVKRSDYVSNQEKQFVYYCSTYFFKICHTKS